MTNTSELFKDNKVTDVNTVVEFIDKYYKTDRLNGAKGRRKRIIEDANERVDKFGCTWISRFESVTGKVVSFYPEPEKSK